MKNLIIKSTPKTPEINFDSSTGILEISGVSVPENAMEFYQKIIKWLDEYLKSPISPLKMVFKLSYVNTSSLQFLYDLLQQIDSLEDTSFAKSAEWYYLNGDDDMKEMGEDFRDAVNMEFVFCEVSHV